MQIKELALLVKGIDEGGDGINITGINGVGSACLGDITFAMNDEHLTSAERSDVSCVLTNLNMRRSSKPLIRVKNPKFSFLVLHDLFKSQEVRHASVHSTAVVSPSAHIGNHVRIGPGVVIEDNVTIGDHVIIESNAVICKDSHIGSFSHIYPNVTLYEENEVR